jgi:type 1 glutamine amidotransferase
MPPLVEPHLLSFQGRLQHPLLGRIKMIGRPSHQFVLAFAVMMCGLPVIALSDVKNTSSGKPIQVLLLSGQNNHDWRHTTPKIQSLLEATGRFEVDVDERPGQLTAETLKPYAVIVSNWNSWGDEKNATWPEALKAAYVDFVQRGGGHVVVHAGSSSFPDWDEYLQVTLATWKLGQTGHGPRHEFTVRIDDADHPVTSGLTGFKIHGELWHRTGIQEGVTVLASAFSAKQQGGSGEDEPIAMVKQIGQGRSFTLLLGHSVDEMKAPGFVALLVRGTEWAATGNVNACD